MGQSRYSSLVGNRGDDAMCRWRNSALPDYGYGYGFGGVRDGRGIEIA